MLRALGAQIEKTTNREACRDLSGRRLRDVNHEKAMADWVKQQAEREAEKEQKRLEKLQRKLTESKHYFTSPEYQQQCHEMAERLEDSVLKGMQAASSKMVSPETRDSRKRPTESEMTGVKSEKRKCFWLGIEELQDAGSSEDDESEGGESPGTSGASCQPAGSQMDLAVTSAGLSQGSEGSVGPRTEDGAPEKPRELVSCPGHAEMGEAEADQGLWEEPAERPTAKEKGEDHMETGEVDETRTGAEVKEETRAEITEEERTEVEIKTRAGVQAEEEKTPVARQEEPEKNLIDLLAFHSSAEMEALGLDRLKSELLALGLKCGGTLQERAARLFSVRGLAKEQIDPALFAKPSKGKKK
ncbi:replication stress response regulator SDE2 isoform X2 [Tachyglossus aculeatus]|nr:replication stress response regulator SDE2 isoform X2 [Tachyglossus aculeatus]